MSAIERLKRIQKSLFDELWATDAKSPDFDAIHNAWKAITDGIKKLGDENAANSGN